MLLFIFKKLVQVSNEDPKKAPTGVYVDFEIVSDDILNDTS